MAGDGMNAPAASGHDGGGNSNGGTARSPSCWRQCGRITWEILNPWAALKSLWLRPQACCHWPSGSVCYPLPFPPCFFLVSPLPKSLLMRSPTKVLYLNHCRADRCQTKAYIGGLDGLRALGILWVVCFHVNMLAPIYWIDHSTAEVFSNWTRGDYLAQEMAMPMRIGFNGHLAVDVFFALSGFHITVRQMRMSVCGL